ncbi:LLM class flavin-dependent oxidoreductase [Caballeronia sp. LjRoot34]|uniref:LLM class flavin-dependent oxidoreductase n=1 Tax=Caballeronia sp. LjRoot34 TaxID=3342325 RepID=UPI003ECEB2B8
MANPMQILWYLRHNDGPYPWKPEGAFEPDHNRVVHLAKTVDRLGFYGALTVGESPFIETATLVPLTERMRFLIPIYPGVYPPALLVKQAQTFDELSGGRLLFNQVNGTDSILPQFGIYESGAGRYKISAEYWKVFKQLYAGEIAEYDGKFFKFGAPPHARTLTEGKPRLVQYPHTPVWGSGASPGGIRHAGEVLDTYLTYLHDPAKLGRQIAAAREVAASFGRTLRAGTLANIIVRETEEEAWDHARWLLEQTGAETIVKQIDARLRHREFDAGGFAGLQSDDPLIQRRIDALRAGRLPDVRELESAPNIWSGPASWSAVDILDKGWGAYLVGSAENVAARMKALQRDIGIDVFILAGWPLTEEAERIASLLLPLLELDTSLPDLRPTAPVKQFTSSAESVAIRHASAPVGG